VAIKVHARRVFAKAGGQRYALVVHGVFSGILASPQNPAAQGLATDGSCVLTVPVIDVELSVGVVTTNRWAGQGQKGGFEP
jgi:hypothetical protein